MSELLEYVKSHLEHVNKCENYLKRDINNKEKENAGLKVIINTLCDALDSVAQYIKSRSNLENDIEEAGQCRALAAKHRTK